MIASNPPILAISLRKSRYSLGIMRAEKEFTVNILSADIFTETDLCGLVSGRSHDNFKECALTPVPASLVKAPIVEQCPFNLECKVVQETMCGDWVILFGEVVETHVDSDAIDTATGKISVSRLNPLVYCATIWEYWNLGNRLGFEFNAGKALIRKTGQQGTEPDA